VTSFKKFGISPFIGYFYLNMIDRLYKRFKGWPKKRTEHIKHDEDDKTFNGPARTLIQQSKCTHQFQKGIKVVLNVYLNDVKPRILDVSGYSLRK